jgi:hypothetical protein
MPTLLPPTLTSVEASWDTGLLQGRRAYPEGTPIIRITFYDEDPDDIVVSIEIERDSGGGFTLIDTVLDQGSMVGVQWFDLSVEDGARYTYRLRSRAFGVDPSPYSDELSAVTPLPKPGPPEAVGDAATVKIKWGVS